MMVPLKLWSLITTFSLYLFEWTSFLLLSVEGECGSEVGGDIISRSVIGQIPQILASY